MSRSTPPGIILVEFLLVLLGATSLITSLSAMALGYDRVPAWMEFNVLAYGVAALLTVALIRGRSPWAGRMFLVWSSLQQCTWILLWPQLGWQLVPGIVGLLAVLVAVFRYIDRWCRAEYDLSA